MTILFHVFVYDISSWSCLVCRTARFAARSWCCSCKTLMRGVWVGMMWLWCSIRDLVELVEGMPATFWPHHVPHSKLHTTCVQGKDGSDCLDELFVSNTHYLTSQSSIPYFGEPSFELCVWMDHTFGTLPNCVLYQFQPCNWHFQLSQANTVQLAVSIL
jgi:hypothetical protein